MNKKILSRFLKRRSTVSHPAIIPVPAPAPTPTPTPTPADTSADQGTSVAHYLRAAKEILQDAASDANIANTTLDEAEIRALEQDAFEVLRLIRFQKKRLPLINRIPPEVLALIPDYWNADVKDQATIALTHVCRAWREIFISRSDLWSDLGCEDINKTLVYLERSGSSPVNVRLERYKNLTLRDPLLQVIPRTVTRLKSVTIHAMPWNFHEIIAQLSHSTPLLASLTIEVEQCQSLPGLCPTIVPTLFNGDLSSLRELRLQCVRPTLPWRNMINLTSFTLGYTTSGASAVGPLLDFFESAPRLRKIQLHFATPTYGTQTGRLVSLARLRRMDVAGGNPSLLLDHLLIPVNAKLSGPFDPPNSLSDLYQLRPYCFRVHVGVAEVCPAIRFGGPDGQFSIAPTNPQPNTTCRVLQSVAQFGPSNIERLTLIGGDLMVRDGCVTYWMFLSLRDLRALTILQCEGLSHLVSWLGQMDMCPKLEELVLDARIEGKNFDMQEMKATAKARTSRLVNLQSVKIGSRDKSVQTSALELNLYIPHVECGPWVALMSDDDDGSDEED